MNCHRRAGQANGACLGKDLKKGNVLRVKGNRSGQTVRCLNGMIWITQQGDNEDRILNSGEMFLSNLPSFILIGALKDAEVKICTEARARSIGWSPQIWQGALTKA
jgi:hypothetical protein